MFQICYQPSRWFIWQRVPYNHPRGRDPVFESRLFPFCSEFEFKFKLMKQKVTDRVRTRTAQVPQDNAYRLDHFTILSYLQTLINISINTMHISKYIFWKYLTIPHHLQNISKSIFLEISWFQIMVSYDLNHYLVRNGFHLSRIEIGRQALNQLFNGTSVHNLHMKSRYYQKNLNLTHSIRPCVTYPFHENLRVKPFNSMKRPHFILIQVDYIRNAPIIMHSNKYMLYVH